MTSRVGHGKRLRGGAALALGVIVAGLTAVSCGGGSGSQAQDVIFPGRCPPGAPAAGGSAGVNRVQIKVVKDGAAAIALAPVCVAGHGPYPFVVDSGATSSVFDSQLVKELHLAASGPAQDVSGASCTTRATPVAAPGWSVGSVPLAAQTVSSIDIPGFGIRSAPAGLLGSDVLSRFGAVQLDYQHESLGFPAQEGPPAGPGPTIHGPSSAQIPPEITLAPPSTSVPLVVAQVQDETLALVPVHIRGQGPYNFILDTGSSVSSVDPHLVSSIGLPQTGKHQRVSGIGCREEAQQVQSGAWSAGGLSLNPQPLQAVAVPGTSGEINGLLGSDVLHGFGVVVIGYSAGTLLVGSH